ncbi:DUF4345 family protein [Parvibaculum sp.]|jgi:hypothetical protein|uniref:DUF4345 family protein n=1 Tax=Parvibaculum sp. TaxID=2024848 RepID=UPI000C3F4B16|nr:DUF4345 family protein [Parvibaculum sp.]MAM94743.1 hypothetical protein [Parvibaculum sp.]HCX67368.1 hypothetical protein [Rhodobiaceae bacterium]|tara:strand:- start:5478 stop:5855 length:378 start_codon:yes stop_codon:yes gene_type:complete
MIWLGRIGVVLVGLFSLAMGLMAFAQPTQLGEALGLGALSPLGLNSLRADLGAFFLAGALAAICALFAGKPQWMWGVAVLYGLAVIGRFLGVVVEGAPEGVAQSIVIELVLVALSVLGAKTLSRN